jgi:two-component system, chemotaxis family, protein-glutamate methylesterase/glutaminase
VAFRHKTAGFPRGSRHPTAASAKPFRSAAECAGRDALAIILTGMGDDGARGTKLLHDRGAHTVAQNEEGCVVFGMPKEAIQLGAVDAVVPLDRVAAEILVFDKRG